MRERREYVRGMEERRKYVRIPEKLPISYEILHKKTIGESITRDISQGGIRFFTHEFIPKGSLLKIKLTIQKISFSLEAVVKAVWTLEESHGEQYEIGVEFIDISEEAAMHLVNYIKSVLEEKKPFKMG